MTVLTSMVVFSTVFRVGNMYWRAAIGKSFN
jgi:hypothetical protein